MSLFTAFLVLIVICSVQAKPYQYAYYISLPGQYQSLEVNDGATILNSPQHFGIPRNNFQPDLALRRGRTNTGFQSPTLNRRPEVPFNRGVSDGELNSRRIYPSPNEFDPAFGSGRINPAFQPQNPAFNRRPEVPFYRGVPDGELDPLFSTQGVYPPPNELHRRNYNPYYGGGRGSDFSTPEATASYGKLTDNRDSQSNDEKFPRSVSPSKNIDEEREEVTTEEPCSFCGVDRVNPKDGIDGGVVADPDSEPVEPKNVGVSPQPPFSIANNAVTPGYGIPYYVIL